MSNANNDNNRKMNVLFSTIGTNSQSFFNKFIRKPSKSTEFLDILERKINMIKDYDVNLTNIEEKINELKKIFSKFIDFSKKIKNDTNLKKRYNDIYNRVIYYICPILSKKIAILAIDYSKNFTIDELQKLKNMQDELLKLFNIYYKIENNKNKDRNKMLEDQEIISNRIILYPRNTNTNQGLSNQGLSNQGLSNQGLSNQLSQLKIRPNNKKKYQNNNY
jgi:hypothetical protein